MTTPSEARQAILQRFKTEWETLGDPSEFVFDSQSFTPGEKLPFVFLLVRNQISQQISLGSKNNRRFRRSGVIIAQVFTESGSGNKLSDTLSRNIVNIFEGVRFNGVCCEAASLREGVPDGVWYQSNVEIDFTYDEIK